MKTSKDILFAMPNVNYLGEKIASELNWNLAEINVTEFADGEQLIYAKESVRAKNVFIVASTSKPVNKNLVNLLIFIDSLKRASARSITVVLSYYGYSRQDRKTAGRQPIVAKLVADLLEKAGATKIITVDIHNTSIQGFFDIPVDDLKGNFILATEISKLGKFTIASPDHGGAVRARSLAELISNSISIAIVDKRRTAPNKSETMGVLGNVHGKRILIIDDMIDTGGTIIKAAEALKKNGAKEILIASTHGLFSNGFEKFDEAEVIDKVIVTDTIPTVHNIKSDKIKIVSVAPLLAKTIDATAKSKPISIIYQSLKKNIK